MFTRERLRDIMNRGAWKEIPGYEESTPLERLIVRGVAGLWLFEMDEREKAFGEEWYRT